MEKKVSVVVNCTDEGGFILHELRPDGSYCKAMVRSSVEGAVAWFRALLNAHSPDEKCECCGRMCQLVSTIYCETCEAEAALQAAEQARAAEDA